MAPDQIVREAVEAGIFPRAGVLITNVVANGGAEKAGLEPFRREENGDIDWGDLIIEIDGKSIERQSDLYDALDDKQVGDTLAVRRAARRVGGLARNHSASLARHATRVRFASSSVSLSDPTVVRGTFLIPSETPFYAI